MIFFHNKKLFEDGFVKRKIEILREGESQKAKFSSTK